MSFADFARLASLMGRVARAGGSSRPHRSVAEDTDRRSLGGVRYDVYQPRRRALGALVALHGVTAHGKIEPRLVAFARALARSGLACVVPELPGLREGSWRLEDLELLEDVIASARDALGRDLALLGFSYGGSYCLVAATRPALRDHVPFVLSFGAYYDFDELARHYRALSARGPRSDVEWEDLVYINCIMAKDQPELLPHAANVLPAARDLVARYCQKGILAEKKRFYLRHLQHQDIVERYRWSEDASLREGLSPRGKLHRLRCRVGVLHDSADVIVPPSEADKIAAELAAASVEHRKLITSMLSHVSFSNVLELGELSALWRVMAPLAESW